jgi:methyl-accepting chemotaxis protein
MKEVKFRWVDRILVNMTIQEKFHVLFWFPLLLILLITSLLMTQNNQLRRTDAIEGLELKLQSAVTLLDQVKDVVDIKLPDGVRLSDSGVVGRNLVGNDITITVQTANQRFLSGTADLSALSIWNGHNSTFVLIVVAILFMAVVSYYLSTFISGAIFSVNKALRRIADGDLTERLNFFSTRDEFSALAQSIDTLAGRQQHTVKLVHDSAEALELFADEFREAAQDGQDTAASQRQYLDSLATAMEEMTAAIREVARNANDTSAQTRHSSEEATQGAASVNRTIDAIQALADEISQASDAVEQLTNRANKISEVVTVINSISGQTNLLALNAAIEAARAGEQGRGFAVVADEVRTLAGRTQQATVEIQKMIEELQSGTGALNQIMEKTVHQAATSRELISGVGHDIERIASYSESVFEMSAQIATSAEQQSAVAAEISQNLEEVRQQSMQVEESTAATVGGTQNLKVTANELDQLLRGLKF